MYGLEFYRYSDIKYIDQLAVWQKIIGKYVKVGDRICNPLRYDKTPKCYLRQWGDIILLTDWARPEFNSFTCVHAYAHLHRLDLDTAITQIIMGDINVLLPSYTSQVDKPKKEKSKIKFVPYVTEYGEPAFRESDIVYWKKRGFTKEELLSDGVFSVWRYSVNGFWYYPEQCYAYTFPSGNVKLYQPYSEMHKWTANTGIEDVWSIGNWTEICVVTKAYKDARIIHKLTGLRVYAYMNEGVLPHNKEELMSHATKYILYDNDDSGMKATEKVMKDIDIIPLFLPVSLAKDIDEVRVKYGEKKTKKILNILLHTSNGNSNIYQHPKWEAVAAGV